MTKVNSGFLFWGFSGPASFLGLVLSTLISYNMNRRMSMEEKKWVPVVRWVARIWSLFPILFGLAEIIYPDHGMQEGVVVPWTDWLSLGILGVSIFGLAVAWRWERIGGWISAGALAVFVVVFLITVERSFPTVLIFILGIGTPAALYLIAAYRK
jgi:hypothetical protein